VIDEIASVDPWVVRGIEIRGSAEPLDGLIRIRPERVVSWGIQSEAIGERHARTVAARAPEAVRRPGRMAGVRLAPE
jgi:hypothetical protein